MYQSLFKYTGTGEKAQIRIKILFKGHFIQIFNIQIFVLITGYSRSRFWPIRWKFPGDVAFTELQCTDCTDFLSGSNFCNLFLFQFLQSCAGQSMHFTVASFFHRKYCQLQSLYCKDREEKYLMFGTQVSPLPHLQCEVFGRH